jgi:hypothetical protein
MTIRRSLLFGGVAVVLASPLWLVAPASADTEPAPYRGTGVTMRGSTTTLSLDKGAEPTYNPSSDLALDIAGAWWFTESLNVSARVGFARELTNSDTSTDRGETVPTDSTLTLGASEFVEGPVGIKLSGSLGFLFPTSPTSRARTLQLGISPGFSVARRFSVLKGARLSYGYRFSGYLHESTTSERDTPVISGCIAKDVGCGEYLNMGLRNAKRRQVHSFDASLGLIDTLTVSAGTALYFDALYDSVEDDRVSIARYDPSGRYFVSYDAGLGYSPTRSITLGLGVSTVNAQLAPDSTYEKPVFNRNTTVYMDLSLELDGLVSQLTPE